MVILETAKDLSHQCMRKYLLFTIGSLFLNSRSIFFGETGQEVLGLLADLRIYAGTLLMG
jgi:hypothetical protein